MIKLNIEMFFKSKEAFEEFSNGEYELYKEVVSAKTAKVPVVFLSKDYTSIVKYEEESESDE